MPDKKYVVPDTLAILPVRDTVLFPGAVLPLTVGRESSLALVNSLSGDEKMLGVVAQLDPRIEDPAAADLHKVGTLAKVHKTVKMPNGNVVVFLEGLQRIRINELLGLASVLARRCSIRARHRSATTTTNSKPSNAMPRTFSAMSSVILRNSPMTCRTSP